MFDKEYVLQVTEDLLRTDSPSGFIRRAFEKVRRYAEALGYPFTLSNKGLGIIDAYWPDKSKAIGVCAHLDTLGLMVRSIRENGTLAVTAIGGLLLPTVDGAY